VTTTIRQKWQGFVQRVNNWLLTMDADPLEDMHRRVRQLEAAMSQMEARRRPAAPPHIEGDCGW